MVAYPSLKKARRQRSTRRGAQARSRAAGRAMRRSCVIQPRRGNAPTTQSRRENWAGRGNRTRDRRMCTAAFRVGRRVSAAGEGGLPADVSTVTLRATCRLGAGRYGLNVTISPATRRSKKRAAKLSTAAAAEAMIPSAHVGRALSTPTSYWQDRETRARKPPPRSRPRAAAARPISSAPGMHAANLRRRRETNPCRRW